MAAAAKDSRLKTRTLPSLSNQRPTSPETRPQKPRPFLTSPPTPPPTPPANGPKTGAQFWLDTGPAQPLPETHPLAPTRPKIDRAILENLLRLNHLRSSAP